MIGQTTHHQILLRSRAVTNTLAPPGLQQELGTRAVARSWVALKRRGTVEAYYYLGSHQYYEQVLCDEGYKVI